MKLFSGNLHRWWLIVTLGAIASVTQALLVFWMGGSPMFVERINTDRVTPGTSFFLFLIPLLEYLFCVLDGHSETIGLFKPFNAGRLINTLISTILFFACCVITGYITFVRPFIFAVVLVFALTVNTLGAYAGYKLKGR